MERLRDALERDGFVLYEQPILDLERGVVDRSELLIRMLDGDGDGGIILPGAFLGAAERYGLIKAIDRWVIARAIRLLAGARPPATTVSGSTSTSQASRSPTRR